MTPIEVVGAILGIGTGTAAILAAINAHIKSKLKSETEMLRREIVGLKKEAKTSRENHEKLETRFNEFMSDMFKYFQIK